MRTFEFKEDKSLKFWSIDLQGAQFTVTFGQVGAKGQTQTMAFANHAQAQEAYDKLIAKKLAKGYLEKAPAALPSSAQRRLEDTLAEGPDNLAAHAAYADYLSEQGDPRGEFIQLQLALEGPTWSAGDREELQNREKEILLAQKKAWLGDLASVLEHGATYQFVRGWLASFRLLFLNVPLARMLARAPQARLLRSLILETYLGKEEGYDPGDDIPEEAKFPALYPLLKAPWLANLRMFQLGEQAEEVTWRTSSNSFPAEGVVDLVTRMPRLEELYLMAHLGVNDLQTLFGLSTLTQLTVLQVYHACENQEFPLATLANNPAFGQLTHLLLRSHAGEPAITLAGVRALLRSPYLSNLTHLRLQLSNIGDKGCQEIARSGILQRLEMLDVRHGCITDAGARILAACPDLRHLKRLAIGRNALTEAGIQALQATGIEVRADGRHRGGDSGEEDYEDDWE
jgi:uncharacterized protein (TIGR02996 family)